MQYVTYYVEANIVCVIILALILSNEVMNKNRADYRIVFSNTLMFQILYFLADSVWVLIDGHVLPKTPLSLGVINMTICILTEACAYFWFLYAEVLSQNTRVSSPKGRVRSAIPILAVTVIFLIRFLTGNFYYLDDLGEMHHPFLYYSTLVLPILYLLYTSIRCVFLALDKRNYADRMQYFSLALYPVIMLIFGVVQLFNQHLPSLCFGATIAVIYVYIISLQNMISSDPLTQLNNRNQLNRYIQQLERDLLSEQNQDLYMIMVDVNKFKNINDTFGHTEGDQALQIIADSLKAVCGAMSENRPFLARYGGDEFIIAAHASREETLAQIADRIRQTLGERCRLRHLPYELSVSIGWAKIRSLDGVRDCIRRADEAMYQNKKQAI